MKSDVIIIGSELDAFIASIRLQELGYSSKIISKGKGSHLYSLGSIKILGVDNNPNMISTLNPFDSIDNLSSNKDLKNKLMSNAKYFREKMSKAGFDIPNGIHPIVPVMLYDSTIAKKMADELLKKGIYVIGFYFPVVPKGEARIRVQISAGMEKTDIDQAIKSFTKIGKELKVI